MKEVTMNAKIKNITKKAWKEQLDKPINSGKVSKVMSEFKAGKLNSSSPKGPKVKKRSQAIAIALNSAKKKK